MVYLLRIRELSAEGCVDESALGRNVKWFRGGLVFKAHRLLYHSTLGSRVIKKKKQYPPTARPQERLEAEPSEKSD